MPQSPDPDATMAWLAGCGWSPSRDIGERARELLAGWMRGPADDGSEGEESAAVREALSFLGRFGDLTLPTASGGALRTVPPAPVADAELAELAEGLGDPVVPVGTEVDGPGQLVVSGGGSYFFLSDDGVEFLGLNPYAVLDRFRPVEEAEVPHTVSTLLVGRTVYTQSNSVGEDEPELHPAVREFLGGLPPYQREPFAARCAESGLISDVLSRLDEERGDGAELTLDEARPHFAESWIRSIAVRPDDDAEHGRPVPPCRSCAALLAELGVQQLVEGDER
ncbi:YwqJ-related putative deaminase [Kitasatospora sp. NPDC092948]|uniref:YwqJ-related putative deaminase n=1 Tax=Kitasatospora sp. NPDC092948 TaxID=3364088 RepID=UPI003821BCB9